MLGCFKALMSKKLVLMYKKCSLSNLIVLTAHTSPVILSIHFLTTPWAPYPAFSPISYLSLSKDMNVSSSEMQSSNSLELHS